MTNPQPAPGDAVERPAYHKLLNPADGKPINPPDEFQRVAILSERLGVCEMALMPIRTEVHQTIAGLHDTKAKWRDSYQFSISLTIAEAKLIDRALDLTRQPLEAAQSAANEKGGER